jgi:glycosyltransferase involved in cell wall biosynthesis
MTIVTPSNWLKDLAKESFLGKYDVQVINNGIDLNVFMPTESNFREKHGLRDKYIILGVANIWDKRKGLDNFIRLSDLIDDKCRIGLVGLYEKQLAALPKGIIGIGKTDNITELAEIYSAADVYVNAGVEETMGLTTVEALACGTPVAVYNATAIPECVDENVGIVVEKSNIHALADAINKIKSKGSHSEKSFSKDSCIKKAVAYNKQSKYKEYLDLYKWNQ